MNKSFMDVNVFVFGSLRNGDRTQAQLIGWEKFYIKEMRYPLIRKKKGNVVKGELIRDVTPNKLREMDYYEGIQPDGSTNFYYQREKVNVQTSEGTFGAFVYSAHKKNLSKRKWFWRVIYKLIGG